MSKYRKPFLTTLGELWAIRLPRWQRGLSTPVGWARKDSTFTAVPEGGESERVFHVVLDFTSKWPGAFTGDIVVSPSLAPLEDPAPHRWPDDIPMLLPGSYRIGWFVASRDIWWRLVDDAAESNRIWKTLPGGEQSELFRRQPYHWYAPDYTLPLHAIIRQAANDFTDTFERHVLPKLYPNREQRL